MKYVIEERECVCVLMNSTALHLIRGYDFPKTQKPSLRKYEKIIKCSLQTPKFLVELVKA